ncbi:Cyclopropane-fatty-acyl-phospholipid synthase [Labilithrix luteola]|uniref:sphingolipid C(9)-methyltransferase n=1 Tax=Labilithrix luteola TaxID=1391654 RepID=A0A0K1Q4V2_9BACT|nr:class I SAM-dependent methyltransferase [Labilithrix luteola]AKV00753.1 Cyclopropane-fatty-acyl-phospholipid synthase [Labilithrix luteola]
MTLHAIRTQEENHQTPESEAPKSGRTGAGIDRFLRFHDYKLAEKFHKGKVPMTTLYEAYFDGQVDITGDIYEFLDERDRYVSYELTAEHVKFLFKNFIPEVAIHSKDQDRRIVREHYDRGNDFFGAFLGDRMVYTAGYYKDGQANSTLEEAQDEKINRCCRKLDLQPGEKLVDIGCGWGTFVRHAAVHFGADTTGITISKNQTEFGNARIEKAGVSDRARVLCLDYRDTPKRVFDKIVSLEMVEHVGVKNLPGYFSQMFNLLKDDGRFLLQWTGLRRAGFDGVLPVGLRAEDMIWGLFMNKYVFPGADASLPLSDMLKYGEKAGFEIHSVENVSIHYAWTIKAWHDNWLANKQQVLETYGERWFRIWHLFLAWSVRIAEQGNAACFQVVFNKNRNDFNRASYVGSDKL